jgi:chromosomal replication initiator protein
VKASAIAASVAATTSPNPNTPSSVDDYEDFDSGSSPRITDELSATEPAHLESRELNQARSDWQKLLGELQLQLAPSAYYTWLHDTWVEAYEDNGYIIGTPSPYARDWLEKRLRQLIRKTLRNILGHNADVRFIIRPRALQDSPSARPAPLYAGPSASSALPEPASRGSRHSTPGSQLNLAYSFDSFIVGSNNRFAWAAAQAVSEKPGFNFNPLFIHGGVGLGKTHLLHAIGNALQLRGSNVLYCSSEQFTNDLIRAIRSQSTEQFRNKYRELDALLIDDIQFIAGKESTQEEFFHTFNTLQAAGKQIVLCSDRPTKALQTLEERLRSRFEGGIQVDISAPDYETRVAILQSKAFRLGIQVESAVIKLVAERVDSNIRELEGALNHLFLHAQMANQTLDLAIASHTLNNLAPQRKPCSPPRIIELTAAHYNLTVDELIGRRRTKAVADARHVAMFLMREDLAMSLPQIGQQFGGRDHTTVAHAIEKIATEVRISESLRRDINTLRDRAYSPFSG